MPKRVDENEKRERKSIWRKRERPGRWEGEEMIVVKAKNDVKEKKRDERWSE